MSEADSSALGASLLPGGRCGFRVWAPRVERVEVRLLSPAARTEPLVRDARGYHSGVLEGVPPGSRYLLRLDGRRERPDPASRLQPEGVHGPSAVVDPSFPWTDARWRGLPLERCLFYELHVGTFSREGTFEGVIPHLPYLAELGVTVVELMPIAQFPGERNWGYDGVQVFAAQASYGGAEGLRRLAAACHAHGLALALDVVYNHLGPEGNYLAEFAPYFTERYRTPWGSAVNFDGADSDEVRRYFVESALYWITDCHVDALRIDAVHAILDHSARPFLQELSEAVEARARSLGRAVHLIAESSLNDTRVVRPREAGGLGMDAQWNDDFHHSLHTLLTGERGGYYQDFGELADLEAALRDGYVLSGRYSAYRRRRHGHSSRDVPATRFVVFAQNHDQVGNRMLGERLAALVDFERQKLAAGCVLLSPFLPLLFMGEEYGEPAPFLYFVSHSGRELIEAVRHGRREEFASFSWQGEPPDPQDQATFRRSKLDHGLRGGGRHRLLLDFHKELVRLRRSFPALVHLGKDGLAVSRVEAGKALWTRRRHGDDEALVGFHLGPGDAFVEVPAGRWRLRLDSADPVWGGPGRALPERIESDGRRPARFAPWSLACFEADTPPPTARA